MKRASITFHLPSHRRTALLLQGQTREAEDSYDRWIGHYIDFLQEEGRKLGLEIKTDQRDVDAVFQIDEIDHDSKKAAHDWLETQPDIWNWIPSP